jgi:hypothetical protein
VIDGLILITVPVKENNKADIGISSIFELPFLVIASYDKKYGFRGATNHLSFRFDPKVNGPSNRCGHIELSEVNPVSSNAFTVSPLSRNAGARNDSILPASDSITFLAF